MKVIAILWLRQIKRYIRSKPRIVGALGQPLLFLLALGFGLGPIFERAGAGNYIEFLTPGVIAMSILFTALFSGLEIIWDRQFGFLKETLVAPVSRLQIVVGRTAGGATIAVAQGLLVLFLSMIAGFRLQSLTHLLTAVGFMAVLAILFTAAGTALASALTDAQAFQLIMNFIVQPLFFLSGAMFPIPGLPRGLQTVVKLNPLGYGVDGIRGALTGLNHFPLPYDLTVLSAVAAVFLVLGSYLFSRIEV